MIRAVAAAASRFLGHAPALLAAVLCARAIELLIDMPPAGTVARTAALALGLDGLAVLRGVPLIFLASLPALVLENERTRRAAVGAIWSVLVVAHVVLMEYFHTTRVPLGADLFGYSLQEVALTFGAGAQVGAAAVLHVALPLACLWAALLLVRPIEPDVRVAAAVLAVGVGALLGAPGQARVADAARAPGIVLDKSAYLVEDTVAWLARQRASIDEPAPLLAEGQAAPQATDPRYPFLHREQTPDVLGDFFRTSATRPNLVFVVVEGLGRSFSGPGAWHGSFTPYLDALAERSLYFENFLANQGRTFAALPTIFGSLPFGDEGFAASAGVKPLPPHVTLLSILAAQGYHARFYAGFDLAFDEERPFLDRQNVESIVDSHDFAPSYPRANSWGYGDAELVARTLDAERRAPAQPAVVVVQTVTLHTPYTFPGQGAYAARLEQRLDQLGVPAEDRAPYRQQSNIYTSILYTDDAVRTLIDGLAATPGWSNTILIVTGDHCLPELPMATRIERYHVPLIVYSPLLKAPARIKSVSSQLDLAPSLLAYLAHAYGVRTPAHVTWLGTGLDVEPRFRNVHEVPLKLAKHLPAELVQGSWYWSRGRLFRLGDGMSEDAADDAQAAARLNEALARFLAANDRFTRTGALMPASAMPDWVAYRAEDRARAAATGAPFSNGAAAAIAVSAVRAPREASAGALKVEADFMNESGKASRAFVPLVVLLDDAGREVSETYGEATQLAAGASKTVVIDVKTANAAAGRYYLAVLPSDPTSGKAVGAGRYRIPVRLR